MKTKPKMHVAEPLHHGQSVEIKHMQHMYYWGTIGGRRRAGWMPSHGPPREAAPRRSWPCRRGAGVHPRAAPVPRRDVACALARGAPLARGVRRWWPRWSPRTRPLLCLWGMGGTWSSPAGSGVASTRAPRRLPGVASPAGPDGPRRPCRGGREGEVGPEGGRRRSGKEAGADEGGGGLRRG